MKTTTKALRPTLQLLIIAMCVLTVVPVYAVTPNDNKPNAGGLRIGLARGGKTFVLLNEPTLIKDGLDKGWHYVREEWNKRIVTLVNEVGKGTLELTSDLATVTHAELQVAQVPQGVSIIYRLHTNQMRLVLKDVRALGDLSYVITFDIVLVLTIQSGNQPSLVEIADMFISLQNSKIDGEDWLSDLMLPMAEAAWSFVQGYVAEIGGALLSPLKAIADQFIATIVEQIPADAIYLDSTVDVKDNTIVLCFKAVTTASCRFRSR